MVRKFAKLSVCRGRQCDASYMLVARSPNLHPFGSRGRQKIASARVARNDDNTAFTDDGGGASFDLQYALRICAESETLGSPCGACRQFHFSTEIEFPPRWRIEFHSLIRFLNF